MTLRERVFYGAFLLCLGAVWGLTQPLTKIAVSTGYLHFGLLFWQMAIGALVMSLVAAFRGTPLPKGLAQWRTCLIIAVVGSIIPNTASYQAYVHLPSGILSILLSMIPIWAFPIALFLALDRFEWRRLAGLIVGLCAVLLLVLPGSDVTGAMPKFWIAIALISGMCYAFEGNFVAKWGTSGLDPAQVLWGASLIGVVISAPLALGTGQWISPLPPYGPADFAQMAASVLHVAAYVGYVWLVPRVGPVFAVQISYCVTLFGVFWAALILNERYPSLVWAALVLMLVGMTLVQPRRRALEARGAMTENGPQ